MKLLLKVLAGCFGLLVVAAAIFLVPQHVQIQAIEPPLPSAAQLRALLAAPGGPIRVSYVNTSSQAAPGKTLGHSIFLTEWPDGKLFMLDAGMDRAAAAEFADLMKLAMRAGDVEIHGSVTELLGADVDRVAGAAFTHLHIDHTQGVVPFCAARGPGTRVYQTSWQAQEHNFNTKEGAQIIRDSCLTSGRLKGDTLLLADEFPGLGIVALGGHTPGSTAFAVASGGELWVFAGDTANSKADVLENRGKGWLYSYLIVPEHTDRTEELRLWFASLDAEPDITVLVSHDVDDIAASGLPRH